MNNIARLSEFPYRKNTAYWKPEGYDQKVYRNILHTIGNTPLVRLNRIPNEHELKCEFYAKCEFFNPGGSSKDRIAYTMIKDCENEGQVTQKTRFIEPTSGNTGIGVALVTAVKGYGCTIVSPDKNSAEKMNTLQLLGADVVMTPSSAPPGDPMHFLEVAKQIKEATPDSIIPDQFGNPVNPMTHYEFVAEEILSALGHVDMIVAGTGTGGAVSGLGHKLKERLPECIVVAVEPKGSIIFGYGEYLPFMVEGIGGDFVPDVLDKCIVDRVERPDDYESFNMARNIIKKEGILCGASSGAVMFGALSAARALGLGPGKRVVVMMSDGIRNYMEKFVTDQWMEAYLFKEPPERKHISWWDHSALNLQMNKSVPIINEKTSFLKAIEAMGDTNNVALVVDNDGFYRGAVSKDSVRGELTNPKSLNPIDLNEAVSNHLIRNVYKLAMNFGSPTVGLVSRILDITPFVVIVEKKIINEKEKFVPKGIITPEIAFSYITGNQKI